MKNANVKRVEVITSAVWSEGRRFQVYGVIAEFSNGEHYRCHDISCRREDAEKLALLLREEAVAYEELPFLVEDFIVGITYTE